jgi:hypothetical protein
MSRHRPTRLPGHSNGGSAQKTAVPSATVNVASSAFAVIGMITGPRRPFVTQQTLGSAVSSTAAFPQRNGRHQATHQETRPKTNSSVIVGAEFGPLRARGYLAASHAAGTGGSGAVAQEREAGTVGQYSARKTNASSAQGKSGAAKRERALLQGLHGAPLCRHGYRQRFDAGRGRPETNPPTDVRFADL